MSSLLEILAILIALATASVGLVLWGRINRLTSHLDALYQEITSLTIANKRMIDRMKEVESGLVRLHSEEGVETGKTEPRPKVLEDIPEKEQESMWQDVLFLAKQGLSADTIARDLNITRGEVELILSLHKFQPDGED